MNGEIATLFLVEYDAQIQRNARWAEWTRVATCKVNWKQPVPVLDEMVKGQPSTCAEPVVRAGRAVHGRLKDSYTSIQRAYDPAFQSMEPCGHFAPTWSL